MKSLKDLLVPLRGGDGAGSGGASSSASPAGISGWFSIFPSEPEPACLPQLSYTKRLTLFVCTGLTGLACLFFSTMFLILPRVFAKWYTLGSLLLLGSTFFLVGPTQQLRSMFQPNRWFASVLYLFSLAGTLYTALRLQNLGLTIIMVVVQTASAVYYGATYVPLGTTCLQSTARSVLPL
jgi:hypothetical protein